MIPPSSSVILASTNRMIFYPITKEHLKRYLLHHSLLGVENLSLSQVLNHFRCIQVDPINVVATSHETALFNRVHNFTRSSLVHELYTTRTLFEYWLQLYSIIPIEFFPYLSARRTIREPWHQKFAQENSTQLNQVRLYIQSNGPTCSLDLTHIHRQTISLFTWSNANTNAALLEYLWDTGEICVSYRKNGHKYYDFTYRLFPNQTQTIPFADSKDWLLESFFHYFGVVRKSQLRRVGYSRNLELDILLDEWVKQGRVVQLEIPSINTKYFIHRSQIPVIENTTVELSQTINILSPLDPLIIDRQALLDFFDFKYTWEAYTPQSKRKFGYYSMPVLYQGEFVGQVELSKSHDSLIIKSSNIQETSSDFRSTFKQEISRLSNFVYNH